jgi:hypothetical protein
VTRNRILLLTVSAGVVGTILGVVLFNTFSPRHISVLTGCVLRADSDPRKQTAIPNVDIQCDFAMAAVGTESSGLFHLKLRPGVEPGQTVVLRLRHPDFEPLNIYENASGELYVLRMTPLPRAAPPAPEGPEVAVGNVRIRYAEMSTATLDVGSAVKSFEVVNTGNVPCDHASLCSPDGKWKAAQGGTSLDAGEGNQFRGARLTCVAGPCPFTRVDADNFSGGGRTISAKVRDWSDTTSFLLEAEVVHTMAGDVIQVSYPVKFGRAMDFTLPSRAEGPSIEAEVSGSDIVYPLGPTLAVPWATCTLSVDKDRTRLYHCDLKPGYHFQ